MRGRRIAAKYRGGGGIGIVEECEVVHRIALGPLKKKNSSWYWSKFLMVIFTSS
jgi:hypothetical protein